MRTDMADIKAVFFTSSYPEERAKSAVTLPTILEGEIGGRIPALPATPENIQSVRCGAGCHVGIEGVASNGGGGWYFRPPDPDESDGVKGGRNRVCTSTDDLVGIVSRSLEGGTAMHEGEGGCLIMADEEQDGSNGDSEKRRLLLGPDLERYSSHLSSTNYKDRRGAQG